MAISAEDLILLRSPWQKQTHFLSVFKPATILTAKVNGSFSLGARQITFDTGLHYAGQSVEGLTLVVETQFGFEKIRIKSISTDLGVSGTITIAENSINWADNQNLTIKQEYLLWPKLPRFVSGGTFWKDYDITYTNQTQEDKTTPVCNIGSHKADFLTGASLVFQLDASLSYATVQGGTISSYHWSTTHGTLSNASIVNPTLTFTSTVPDGAIITCTVTDDNGNSQTGHRVYFVHSPDSTSSAYPIVDFEYESSPSGDWDKGGWDVRLRVSQDASSTVFPDGTLILLWEKSVFGITSKSIAFDSSNIIFAGYTTSESITSDEIGYKQTSFQASTIVSLLSNKYLHSVSMETASSPDKWWKYNDNLNTARAAHFYLKWHSTLFEIADFFCDISSEVYRRFAEFDAGSILQSLLSVTEQAGEFMKLCSNKRGQVYLEKDIQLLGDTDRGLIETLAEIELSDIKDEIKFSRIQDTEFRIAQVQLSGFCYDGTEPIAKTSKAPGESQAPFGGSLMPVERQILASQSQANELAGRCLAKQNNTFTEVNFSFNGIWAGYLDLVPQNWFTLSLNSQDTNRGIVWNSQKLVPRSITNSFSSGAFISEVTFEKEAFGFDGVSGVYSSSVPESTGEFGSNLGGLITASSINTKYGREEQWTQRTSEATSCLILDPFWKQITGSSNPFSAILIRGGVGTLYRSTDGGITWSSVRPTSSPPNTWIDSPAPSYSTVTYHFLESSKETEGTFICGARWVNSTGLHRYWLLQSTDGGLTWSWL
jgi:hypothetical protein